MREQSTRQTVIIEISGGVVREVYATSPDTLRMIVIDWDNINDGDTSAAIGVTSLRDLPPETREQIERAVGDNHVAIKDSNR